MGVGNAVFIKTSNFLYLKLAVALNNWENHRTETEHSDNLIIKSFLFTFMNR